jgi:uncharacterized protein (DUF433 family)
MNRVERINEDLFIPKSIPKELMIQSTPEVCFGKPRIRNTRIPVWLLMSFRNQGASNQELLRNYPSLTLNDLRAAWDYYRNHKDEIDPEIAYQHRFEQDLTD